MRGSIVDTKIISTVLKIVGSRADIVLSDLSPNVSGIWDLDYMSTNLPDQKCLGCGSKDIEESGTSVFKVFEGESLNGLSR